MADYRAVTLVQTESAHIADLASQESYKQTKVQKFEWLATLEIHTCETCGGLDGQQFEVEDLGALHPPRHPNCRCTTCPVLEGWEHRHRWSRDPITGKGANGKYQTFVEWKKENVTPEALKQLKINRNKKQDGEILKEYKSVIGKNTPSNLAEFQKLKYNGGRDWQLTKLDYQRCKRLIDNPDLKLPNAGKASIDNRKFTEYLFGGSNEKGLIKGRLITNKLGYSLDNYGSLKNEILKRATEYPSLLKYTDAHGSRYEQKMIMYGPENKPVNIIAGWNVENGKTHMSTILIKEVK